MLRFLFIGGWIWYASGMRNLLLFPLILILAAGCSMRSLRSVSDVQEEPLLSQTRQLIFGGKRSGEGYFGADGKQLIFQSEREPGNPFYQMYLMNMDSGETRRVSPGTGKSTCGWIHPTGKKVLFASTHADPKSRMHQKEELRFRESGKTRRYSWDYDPSYDIWETGTKQGALKNLTRVRGYDAEGSYSPDGKWIAFSSNRHAYSSKLSKADKEKLEKDPSYFLDIYLMRADGTGTKRLTTSPGYDGGPFFSPDGKRIVWRRFSADGAKAEIFTMNADGGDERQVTRLDAMSWAPFYHPSGDYLVFTNNLNGFDNFELYIVDVNGQSEPKQVTFSKGFDGLPAFSPDGKRLVWSSGRGLEKATQLFVAAWNDEKARKLLGIKPIHHTEATAADLHSASELKQHVSYLASDELEGRDTGSEGEKKATRYVAQRLKSYGFKPAGDNGSYFDSFEFSAGVALGDKNKFNLAGKSFEVAKDWMPTSFSASGTFKAAPVVFAGYGMSTPLVKGGVEYDSYAHLDVKGKWVLALRSHPTVKDQAALDTLKSFSSLRHKATVARDHGARGIILVAGGKADVKDEIVPLGFEAALAGTSMPVVTISRNLADKLLESSGKTLSTLESELITGEQRSGFLLPEVKVSAEIELKQKKLRGRSVVARLASTRSSKLPAIVVGAHIDHLGHGLNSNSLARENEAHQIHHGADDNASGVAAVLGVAKAISELRAKGKFDQRRDLIVALWSGEELGLLGSTHFLENFKGKANARGKYGAYLNLDMVGRLTDKYMLQGGSSSPTWAAEVEKANLHIGLPISFQADSYLPTDSTPFYLKGVPILSGFTGLHSEYHSPRDVESLINYDGLEKITEFTTGVVRGLLASTKPIPYVESKRPEKFGMRANLRAYLGTIPDYGGSSVLGLKLSGVMKGGPAEKAGLQGGDIIVKLGEKKVENIYDYTFAIGTLSPGVETSVGIERSGKRLDLKLTPGQR